MENVKITVIVTVHNAEKYLKECLDSVISQTFKNIEILCMDGGSTDLSPQILKEYACKDERIRIINDKNTSYGHKVNEGILQAKGEYISVLESDDMYQPYMLEKLYQVAQKYHPDYVNADYYNFYNVGGKRYYALVKMYKEEDYGKLLKCNECLQNMRQILRYWTGIFRKDFLLEKEIKMNESPGASFQDMSFRFLTSVLANTTFHIDLPVYLYRIDNPNSSVYDSKKIIRIVDEFEFLKRKLVEKNIESEEIWRHFYKWKYCDLYRNLARFKKEDRKELFEQCYSELKKDRKILESISVQDYSVEANELVMKPREMIWRDLEEIYSINQTRDNWLRMLISNLKEERIVIFGCGKRGRHLLNYLKMAGLEKEIYCYTDNDEELWNSKIEGYLVLPPSQVVEIYPEAIFIVANRYHGDVIKIQLREMGIEKSHIYEFE